MPRRPHDWKVVLYVIGIVGLSIPTILLMNFFSQNILVVLFIDFIMACVIVVSASILFAKVKEWDANYDNSIKLKGES